MRNFEGSFHHNPTILDVAGNVHPSQPSKFFYLNSLMPNQE